MTIIVNKWGNSLGVRIPQALANQIGISVGSRVKIEVVDSKIIISPVGYALDDLLMGVSPEIVGGEYDWGDPVGMEAW